MSTINVLSVNGDMDIEGIEVFSVKDSEIASIELARYDYLIISGGDGAIRRCVEAIYKRGDKIPPIIINPEGTFNLICKAYGIKSPKEILEKAVKNQEIKFRMKEFFSVNDKHIFVFSAGNSLDMLYIVLSDLFRVGLIARSKIRYFFSIFFLLPLMLVAVPIFLFIKSYFFVFNIYKLGIKRFCNLYFDEQLIEIKSNSDYNIWQMDGDIVIVRSKNSVIKKAGEIKFLIG